MSRKSHKPPSQNDRGHTRHRIGESTLSSMYDELRSIAQATKRADKKARKEKRRGLLADPDHECESFTNEEKGF